jgi:hypothetical protein
MKFIVALFLVLFSFSAIAGVPGDKMPLQGVCLNADSAKVVATAIVNDEDANDAAASTDGGCALLPMPIVVTLKEVVDRVKGTNGRVDILIWKLEDERGRTLFGLELDTGRDS